MCFSRITQDLWEESKRNNFDGFYLMLFIHSLVACKVTFVFVEGVNL